MQGMGGQGDPGKDPQQDGSSAGDGQVGPLALGFHVQMGPRFLKSDLKLPAQHKPLQDLCRRCRRVGARRAWGSKAPWGSRISTQRMRTGGLPERYQTAVWEVSSTASAAIVPSHCGGGPSHVGLIREHFKRRPPQASQRRAAVLSWLTGGRWSIQGGVQAQSGDESDRLAQGLTAVEQVQDGIAVVAHQHQRPLGQPAAQQHDHLPGPVG